jgi:hypothetical protein
MILTLGQKKRKLVSFHHLIPFLTGLFVLFVFLLGDEAVT